jgi:imidazolonepropionase
MSAYALAVINIRQLVTLSGPPHPRTGAEMRELGIVEDAALLARNGKITAVGKRAEIAIPSDAEIVDAGGRIVLPGFVDAHTHPVFAGTRADEYEQRVRGVTYAEIAAKGGGIRATVRRTREATDAELSARAARYAEWFLRGGTTTIEAKSGYGLSLESELKILRVIRQMRPLRTVPTFLGAHETPDEFRGRREEYVKAVIHEMLPRVAAERLAEFCDVFCEPSVFPVEEARQVLSAAQRWGLGLRLHADQFTADFAAPLAAELGAVTADHLEETTDAGLRALQAAKVQPVVLPASVYTLGLRHYPAARRMIELGMPVTLATDFNPGTSPTASMPMVLSLACAQLKMTPAEAITAATINAAYSLRRGDSIGSLEPGKLADFAIHDCEDYRELPYFFGRETARAVYIGGAQVYLSQGIGA